MLVVGMSRRGLLRVMEGAVCTSLGQALIEWRKRGSLDVGVPWHGEGSEELAVGLPRVDTSLNMEWSLGRGATSTGPRTPGRVVHCMSSSRD